MTNQMKRKVYLAVKTMVILILTVVFCAQPAATATAKRNSKFRGVQVGVITIICSIPKGNYKLKFYK